MEETQNVLQGIINFDQFKVIKFGMGLPYIIIDFLIYISGESDQIKAITTHASSQFKDQNLPALSYKDVFAQKYLIKGQEEVFDSTLSDSSESVDQGGMKQQLNHDDSM